jgi:hypothetical protein
MSGIEIFAEEASPVLRGDQLMVFSALLGFPVYLALWRL